MFKIGEGYVRGISKPLFYGYDTEQERTKVMNELLAAIEGV